MKNVNTITLSGKINWDAKVTKTEKCTVVNFPLNFYAGKGKDGANGVPGTAILIQGKLSSPDLLPNASTAPRNYGYLISINNVVYLYFIAGIEGEETWERIEYSGNGTIVTTDGIAQSTWDTNTKVSKVTTASNLYATDENGNQTSVAYT